MHSFSVITFDGPAGSGKSTLAGLLAERIGYIHADSGAIYRTLTLFAMETISPGSSHEEFGELFQKRKDELDFSPIQTALQNGKQCNLIAGRDVGDAIRSVDVTRRIRYIADDFRCRNTVNSLLRLFSEETNLVADGRDMGTVVFPETPFKFFIEASVEIRAERRQEDFRRQGKEIPLSELITEIERRDEEDRNRTYGALRKPDDAILIDTSAVGINDALGRIMGILQIRF